MIATAHLRVYVRTDLLDRIRPRLGAAEPVRPRMSRYGLVGESLEDDAFVTEWAGRRYACPRQAWLRTLEGVLALHRAFRRPDGGGLIPEAVAGRAAEELAELEEVRPGARSHILTSPWHVPLRWFVPFSSADREASPGDPPLLRYRTALRTGMRRLGRAEEILAGAGMPGQISEEVGELRSWLHGFQVDAMLELDYGTVAGLFEPLELLEDDSAGEIWSSLEALGEGDWERAAGSYGSVVTRWGRRQAVSYSN